MKKLTAGILTVMLGLVVADANAAITSKAYVDEKIKGVSDSVTAITNNMGDTIATTIANQLKNEESDISKELAKKADADDLDALTDRVDTAEGAITTLNSGETVEGSVDYKIKAAKDALTTDVDGKQTKSTAAYQMGGANGTWETMSQAQQDALNSGADTTKIGKIATNESAIEGIKGEIGTLDSLETETKDTVVGAINSLNTAVSGLSEGKTIADGAVTTDKIADGAVTTDKLADIKDLEAGTATKVTFNAKGQITGSSALTADDIPELTAEKISNLNKLASAPLPASCGEAGATCVLKFDGTNYSWEDIQRAESGE